MGWHFLFHVRLSVAVINGKWRLAARGKQIPAIWPRSIAFIFSPVPTVTRATRKTFWTIRELSLILSLSLIDYLPVYNIHCTCNGIIDVEVLRRILSYWSFPNAVLCRLSFGSQSITYSLSLFTVIIDLYIRRTCFCKTKFVLQKWELKKEKRPLGRNILKCVTGEISWAWLFPGKVFYVCPSSLCDVWVVNDIILVGSRPGVRFFLFLIIMGSTTEQDFLWVVVRLIASLLRKIWGGKL